MCDERDDSAACSSKAGIDDGACQDDVDAAGQDFVDSRKNGVDQHGREHQTLGEVQHGFEDCITEWKCLLPGRETNRVTKSESREIAKATNEKTPSSTMASE